MMQSQTILLQSDHAINVAILRFSKINRPDKEESLTNLIVKFKRTKMKPLKMYICTLINRMKVLMISLILTSRFFKPYHLNSSPPKLDLMSKQMIKWILMMTRALSIFPLSCLIIISSKKGSNASLNPSKNQLASQTRS